MKSRLQIPSETKAELRFTCAQLLDLTIQVHGVCDLQIFSLKEVIILNCTDLNKINMDSE